jgi:general secretion pathway protein M
MRQLSQKDRRALIICATALLLFVVIQFVLFPLMDERKQLLRGISSREKALLEMRLMQQEIRQVSSQSSSLSGQVARRSPSFSLFSFLEQKGEQAQVKENILYIKPSNTEEEGELRQVAVEMKLQGVPLDRLVALLKLIESPEQIVAVERIAIMTNKKEQGGLDAVLRVVSLVQAGEGGD